jgi:hypothetical protein
MTEGTTRSERLAHVSVDLLDGTVWQGGDVVKEHDRTGSPVAAEVV